MDIKFDEAVRELREVGYSDAQLARLCNCTRQYIYSIRNGKTKEIGFRIGRRLEKLYGAIQ